MKPIFYFLVNIALTLTFSIVSLAQNDTTVIRDLLPQSFKEKKEALKSLSTKINKSNSDTELAELLTKRYELLTALEEIYLARNDLERAVVLANISSEKRNKLRLLLATNYEITNRHISATNLYDLILKDEPSNIEVILLRIKKYLLGEDFESAKKLIDCLLTLDPNNLEGKFFLSEYLFNTGDLLNSINILQDLYNLKTISPITLKLKHLATFRLVEHSIGEKNFVVAKNLLSTIENPTKEELLKVTSLSKIINDSQVIEKEFLSFQNQNYSKDFLIKAARFNETWLERSPCLKFSSSLVNIVTYQSSTKIKSVNKDESEGLTYYQIDEKHPLIVEIEGPTILRLGARPIHSQQTFLSSTQILIKEDNLIETTITIQNNKPSSEVTFVDLENIFVGVKELIDIKIPSGKHRYEIYSLLGTSFIRPLAAIPFYDDYLVGSISSTQWWARFYYQSMLEQKFDSINEIESRYYITNNFDELINSISQLSKDNLGYYGWLLLANSKRRLGKTFAQELSEAAKETFDSYLSRKTTIEAITQFLKENNEPNAINLAKSWLKLHPKDDEIRVLLINIFLNSSTIYDTEAWIESEKIVDPLLKEKLAPIAARRINWDRRLSVLSAAGVETIEQLRFETTNPFRATREVMLDSIFAEDSSQIISPSLSAKLEASLSQPVNFQAKVYAQVFDTTELDLINQTANSLLENPEQTNNISLPTPQLMVLPLEVTLDGAQIKTLLVKEKELFSFPLPTFPSGSHELKIGILENNPQIQSTNNSAIASTTPIKKRISWYVNVQLERTDNNTILQPKLQYNHFIATPTKSLQFNAFASSLVRLTLRSIIRDVNLNNLFTDQVQIKITNNLGQSITQLFKLSTQETSFTKLTFDKNAKVSDKNEIAILLPTDGHIYTLEVTPSNGELLALVYDGKNSQKKTIYPEEQQMPGFNLESIAKYQKPGQVTPFSINSQNFYELGKEKNYIADKGLFSFYKTVNQETSLQVEEGIRNIRRTGDYFLESGIVNRKAFNENLFFRNLIGERFFSSASPLLHLESEFSRYFNDKKILPDNTIKNNLLRINAQSRFFLQNTPQGIESAFRIEANLSKRFSYPKKHLSITPLFGYYRVWQSLDSITRKDRDKISRDIFLPFYTTKPQGFILQNTISYTPFIDTLFSAFIRLTSNSNLNPFNIDRVRYQLRAAKISLAGRLETQIIFSQSFNSARNSINLTNNFLIKSEYGIWLNDDRRLTVETGVRFVSNLHPPTFTFTIKYDINRAKKFSQYDPNDIIFEEQKLREYKEKVISNKIKP